LCAAQSSKSPDRFPFCHMPSRCGVTHSPAVAHPAAEEVHMSEIRSALF
jgi:hypothetical protein